MARRVRPLARTLVLGAAGVLCAVGGVIVASGPTVALGAIILVAVAVDGVRFALVEARAPLALLQRTAYPNPCPVGQPLTVGLSPQVKRRGWGDDPSALEETLPADLASVTVVRPSDPSTAAGRTGLFYDIHPTRRGQWTVGPCFVRRFSPLGMWWTRIQEPSTCEITVWPRWIPLDIPVLAHDREGVVGATGFVQPHQDNAIVRVYNPGDDLRRVHWRSSARHGELMTRAEEPTDSDQAWVGLWTCESLAFDRRETAISLAASWLRLMETTGRTVELACGGETHHGVVSSHLTHLAALDDHQASLPLPSTTPEGMSLLVIACSPGHGLTPDHLVHPPQGRGRERSVSGALAVVFSDVEADASLLSAHGWTVLRVGSSASLDEAGARLAHFIQSAQMARLA
ncbi:MAG: DUF58 domain-containing protein [Propionibacteriaceae bacterium]|nr:DUF58 domain-containing protein [Propionibacteriaceae bacterium]